MSTLELTPADITNLRRWLRSRLSATHRDRTRPAWLVESGVVDPAEIRAEVRVALERARAAEHITAGQTAAWTAGARLNGDADAASQVALAAEYGVSARTVRQWVTDVDRVLAEHFSRLPLGRHTRTRAEPVVENIDTAVQLARLTRSLAADGAAPEELDAVRSFAVDRLGGRPVRRAGSRRWVRKRAYETVADRLDVLKSRPIRPDTFLADPAQEKIVQVPYRLSEDPDTVVAELGRAWRNRDREFIPLLANHALGVLRSREVPATHRLHALEVIANALRDAENLQAFECAAAWRALALRVGGPNDYRAWKASGLLIHMMQIHGHVDAARNAQLRQIDTFARIEFPDLADREIHFYDKVARLVAIELQSADPGSTERAERALRRLRDLQYTNGDEAAETGFAVDRRRVEVALTDFQRREQGQAIGIRPEFDAVVQRIETTVASMEPHRALAALDLLLMVDVQRGDWISVRGRVEVIRRAASVHGAPANLVHRLDGRLRQLARRGRIQHVLLPSPLDPFRDIRFLPHVQPTHP